MSFDTIDYLTDYYDVSEEEAVKLGTRAKGRKPNLPASKTCKAISDMTMEDLWALKERETQEDIWDFYVAQGAWSTFRQCVRHRELVQFHINVFQHFFSNNMHICEYGGGVAPFSFTLCNIVSPEATFDISLSDIEDCEHLNFGSWRLNKVKEDKNLTNVTVDVQPVKANELPRYKKKIDLAIIFEVLEHVPSPMKTLSNIMQQMNSKGLLLENFIAHQPGEAEDDGPDLDSAAAQRKQFYDIIKFNFNLVAGMPEETHPNDTRVWQLKY